MHIFGEKIQKTINLAKLKQFRKTVNLVNEI